MILKDHWNSDPESQKLDPEIQNLDPGNQNLGPGNQNFDPGIQNSDPGIQNLDPENWVSHVWVRREKDMMEEKEEVIAVESILRPLDRQIHQQLCLVTQRSYDLHLLRSLTCI